MRRALIRLARDERGSSLTEFALILPVMLVFLFGIMDAGWYMWQVNQLEKSTQFGARMAVVTDVVAPGIANQGYVGSVVGGVTLKQGDQIPAAALGLVTCTNTSCACTTAPCPANLGYNGAAFTRVVNRMRTMDSRIQAANVRIEYRGSGLGYAGDPSGMEIAPLTTVRLANMQHTPLLLWPFGATAGLPDASYSLTMEDGSGSVSN